MLGTSILSALIVVIAVIVVLCALGKIQRNTIVGIRVPAFFASDDAWMTGHRAAILPLVVSAVLGLGVVILVAISPAIGDTTGTLINCALLLAGVIWGAARGARAIRRES